MGFSRKHIGTIGAKAHMSDAGTVGAKSYMSDAGTIGAKSFMSDAGTIGAKAPLNSVWPLWRLWVCSMQDTNSTALSEAGRLLRMPKQAPPIRLRKTPFTHWPISSSISPRSTKQGERRTALSPGGNSLFCYSCCSVCRLCSEAENPSSPTIRRSRCFQGQATVEVALLIPLFFLLLLLLFQPIIILYDYMVMTSAAGVGCRVLITSSEATTESTTTDFIKRRLGAIPPIDYFHVQGKSERTCTWRISYSGNKNSDYVRVTISTQVRLLPLIDIAATMMGIPDESGTITLEKTVRLKTQPDWVH